MYNTARTLMYRFLCRHIFYFSGYIPRSGTARSYGKGMLTL